MRRRSFLLGLAIGWFGLSSPARAILIVEKAPGAVPVGGYLVSEAGQTLKIKMILPDGKEQSKVYDLSNIEILYKIDVDRLKKLDKNDPKAYLDYALELAAKKLDADPGATGAAGRLVVDADPEARDTARRLFLIAAYLDPRQLGSGGAPRHEFPGRHGGGGPKVPRHGVPARSEGRRRRLEAAANA